jgi:hypothetical protein
LLRALLLANADPGRWDAEEEAPAAPRATLNCGGGITVEFDGEW